MDLHVFLPSSKTRIIAMSRGRLISAVVMALVGTAMGTFSPAGCFSHGQCLGGTALVTSPGVPSLKECLEACRGYQGCQAVTYIPGKKELWDMVWVNLQW